MIYTLLKKALTKAYPDHANDTFIKSLIDRHSANDNFKNLAAAVNYGDSLASGYDLGFFIDEHINYLDKKKVLNEQASRKGLITFDTLTNTLLDHNISPARVYDHLIKSNTVLKEHLFSEDYYWKVDLTQPGRISLAYYRYSNIEKPINTANINTAKIDSTNTLIPLYIYTKEHIALWQDQIFDHAKMHFLDNKLAKAEQKLAKELALLPAELSRQVCLELLRPGMVTDFTFNKVPWDKLQAANSHKERINIILADIGEHIRNKPAIARFNKQGHFIMLQALTALTPGYENLHYTMRHLDYDSENGRYHHPSDIIDWLLDESHHRSEKVEVRKRYKSVPFPVKDLWRWSFYVELFADGSQEGDYNRSLAGLAAFALMHRSRSGNVHDLINAWNRDQLNEFKDYCVQTLTNSDIEDLVFIVNHPHLITSPKHDKLLARIDAKMLTTTYNLTIDDTLTLDYDTLAKDRNSDFAKAISKKQWQALLDKDMVIPVHTSNGRQVYLIADKVDYNYHANRHDVGVYAATMHNGRLEMIYNLPIIQSIIKSFDLNTKPIAKLSGESSPPNWVTFLRSNLWAHHRRFSPIYNRIVEDDRKNRAAIEAKVLATERDLTNYDETMSLVAVNAVQTVMNKQNIPLTAVNTALLSHLHKRATSGILATSNLEQLWNSLNAAMTRQRGNNWLAKFNTLVKNKLQIDHGTTYNYDLDTFLDQLLTSSLQPFDDLWRDCSRMVQQITQAFYDLNKQSMHQLAAPFNEEWQRIAKVRIYNDTNYVFKISDLQNYHDRLTSLNNRLRPLTMLDITKNAYLYENDYDSTFRQIINQCTNGIPQELSVIHQLARSNYAQDAIEKLNNYIANNNLNISPVSYPLTFTTPFSHTQRVLDFVNDNPLPGLELIASRYGLDHEGISQSHCVASYDNAVKNGKAIILSWRDEQRFAKEKHKKVTVELGYNANSNTYYLVQVRGRFNKDYLNTRNIEPLREWVNNLNNTNRIQRGL